MAPDPGRSRILGIAVPARGRLVEELCRRHGPVAVLDLDLELEKTRRRNMEVPEVTFKPAPAAMPVMEPESALVSSRIIACDAGS